MNNKHLELFIEKIETFVNNASLIKLSLKGRRDKSSDLKSIIISIVELKKGLRLSFVYRHETNDITKNYEYTEGFALIRAALEKDFSMAELLSNNENITLTINPNGKVQVKTVSSNLEPLKAFKHDRVKERFIDTAGNIYLHELGITNAVGELRREMSDKYKQINRYIELLEPNLAELSVTDDTHVVDMGAGKGYLTFALYDYLVNIKQKKIKMTGVDTREDLVKSCNAIAQKAGFTDLTFMQGTIEKTELPRIDVLIALHACDTATDEAIYRGIKSGAELIVCAPCCHKQIRKEFNVTNELSNVVRFGILKERQAEIITDSLRAMIMEVYGYKTNVFEFISTEHTPKNVMIVGRKVAASNPDKTKLLHNIAAVKEFFGIRKHYLETLLTME